MGKIKSESVFANVSSDQQFTSLTFAQLRKFAEDKHPDKVNLYVGGERFIIFYGNIQENSFSL